MKNRSLNDSDWTFSVPYTFCRLDLTKFVNGYLSQDNAAFIAFLACQANLESLELHSGKTTVFKSQLSQVSLNCLRTLGCPPQFLDTEYNLGRLRLNFDNSTDNRKIDVLGRVLNRNLTRNMKSLVIILKQEQSYFAEIIRAIAVSDIYIQHLEIHQLLPIQVCP